MDSPLAASLRSILRHDPDVVLVGEIRDLETAENATQASLTGHLVFSTMHTNDSASAFGRLCDMGVEPFLVSSTVEGVMAQRLVRRLCPDCCEPHKVSRGDVPEDFPWERMMDLGKTVYRPAGCPSCRKQRLPRPNWRLRIARQQRRDSRTGVTTDAFHQHQTRGSSGWYENAP